jgi:hypothetical protein
VKRDARLYTNESTDLTDSFFYSARCITEAILKFAIKVCYNMLFLYNFIFQYLITAIQTNEITHDNMTMALTQLSHIALLSPDFCNYAVNVCF